MRSCWLLFGSGFIVFGTWYVIVYRITCGTFAAMPMGLAFRLAAIVAGLFAGTDTGTSEMARCRWAVWQFTRDAQRYVYDPPLARLGSEFTPPLALRLRAYTRNAGRVLRVWMRLEALWPRCGGR